jgi:hypothetical protein
MRRAECATHQRLTGLLSCLELWISWIEVARAVAVDTNADADSAGSRRNLWIGKVADAMGAHALGELERLGHGLGLLRRAWGLATVWRVFGAGALRGLERGGLWPDATDGDLSLGVRVGEARDSVGAHALSELHRDPTERRLRLLRTRISGARLARS